MSWTEPAAKGRAADCADATSIVIRWRDVQADRDGIAFYWNGESWSDLPMPVEPAEWSKALAARAPGVVERFPATDFFFLQGEHREAGAHAW